MAKLSELISKHILSLYNGQIEGVIENALFSCETNKVKYFIVFNENNENTFVLPANKIYAIGNGAISIKNNSGLSLYESKELELCELCNPVNSSVFRINGDYEGVIVDIELDDKFGIENIILNNGTVIHKDKLASYNSATTLIQSEESKVNVKNFAGRTKVPSKSDDTRIVNILQIRDDQDDAFGVVKNDLENKVIMQPHTTLIPNRAITNYNFLINRKVRKNITNQNGLLIIKQNTKINTTTIDIARQNGKLKELTKYSL